jgi:hypothetical protein
MPNTIFQTLSEQKINTFTTDFINLSRSLFTETTNSSLYHPGEFGTYREKICADFLQTYIPSYLKIGNGFLINKNDEKSTQCDLVFFDPQYTPKIEDLERKRFFPVETVAGIGEVKSVLSQKDFFSAIIKLAKSKQIGDIEDKYPIRRSNHLILDKLGHHYDEMISIIICEKLEFSLKDITSKISKVYEEANIHPKHRHNLILSIQDGIFCYKNQFFPEAITWVYPWTKNEKMKNRLISPGENSRNHFGVFITHLFLLFSNVTIYLPHLADYDTPQVAGFYQDER